MKHLFYETRESNGEIYVLVTAIKFKHLNGDLQLTFWTSEGIQPSINNVIEFSIH